VSVSAETVLLYVLDLGGACSKDQVRLRCRSGGDSDTVYRCCSNQGYALVRRYAQAVVVLVVAANLDAERPTKR
jgi:hypothetical protein